MDSIQIAVLGLGYVGLPLAVEFSRKYPTIGFDTNPKRIEELSRGNDWTGEVDKEDLISTKQLSFTSDPQKLNQSNFLVVAVPTPIDEEKRPDLSLLKSATTLVAEHLNKADYVVFESTVFPGATEEVCVPILEEISGLRLNEDFFVGYSPERINPGDKKHRLPDIVKVTSGSTSEAADHIDSVYGSIVTAGTFKAASIRVAEAAKVIENTQRDLNVALMNELAMIFSLMDIDTESVLAAAGTKWNFLSFQPGLVGGHCIGVDPYYLTHKSTQLGYAPEIILSGRKINDGMGRYIVEQIIKLMTEKSIAIRGARILVLGFAFKENCADTRNTKVVDIVRHFVDWGTEVDVFDPYVLPDQVQEEYGIALVEKPHDRYDAIVLAVAHDEFLDYWSSIEDLKQDPCVVYDIKRVWSTDVVDGRL